MESLPVEIRTDILTRLDTKTLTRFLCVSKPFSSFVSTPDFITAHRRRLRLRPQPSSARLLYSVLVRSPDSYGLVSFDTAAESARDTGIRTDYLPYRVKTCFDLVCLTNDDFDVGFVSILNPTSGYFFSLPEQPLGGISYDYVGFGYVSSTGRYKLLRVTIQLDCVVVGTHVFTLDEDESWRSVVEEKEENTPSSLQHCSPATVDHSVYFMGEEEAAGIFKFDLEREEWSVLPPLPFATKSITGVFVELGGKLCLVERYDVENNEYIDIWVLKDFDSYSWVKAYNINMSSYVSKPEKLVKVYPLAVEKDDKLLISMDVDDPNIAWRRTKLMRYDPRNGRGEYINLDGIILPGNEGRVIQPLTFYMDGSSALEG